MPERILIALRKEDRIEEMIPYLERIAKPGVKVVFLVPYMIDGFGWLVAQLGTMQTEMQILLATKKMADRYSWEGQRRAAEERIRPAKEALSGQAVEVGLDLYTGSLRKVLGRYTAAGQFLLMRTEPRFRIGNFFLAKGSFSKLFRGYTLPPVSLLQPNRVV